MTDEEQRELALYKYIGELDPIYVGAYERGELSPLFVASLRLLLQAARGMRMPDADILTVVGDTMAQIRAEES